MADELPRRVPGAHLRNPTAPPPDSGWFSVPTAVDPTAEKPAPDNPAPAWPHTDLDAATSGNTAQPADGDPANDAIAQVLRSAAQSCGPETYELWEKVLSGLHRISPDPPQDPQNRH
jgi:hypothetical protein